MVGLAKRESPSDSLSLKPTRPVRVDGSTERSAGDWEDEAEEAPFKPLAREQAEALRRQHPVLSPWQVVLVQALVGLLVSLVAWAVTRSDAVGWSALYGAAVVVVSQAVLARGMSRLPTENVRAAAMGFMVWELIKIAVAVSMLAAAQVVVPSLSWPALLVALVVCLKASWLALLMRRRVR